MRARVIGIALATVVLAAGCSAETSAESGQSSQSATQASESSEQSSSVQAGNGHQGGPGGPGSGAGTQTPQVGTLSQTEKDLLTFGREEERMAQDLYLAFDETYDMRVFSTIASSETHHFSILGAAIEQSGVTDPSAGRAAGSFAFPAIQDLYDAWLDQGQASAKSAVEAAIELEKRDIADLELAISQTDDPGLKQIFENLKAASENHLSAFENVHVTL